MASYLREVGRQWQSLVIIRRWPLTFELSLIAGMAFREDRPFIGGFSLVTLAMKLVEMEVTERRLKAEIAQRGDG